LVDTGQHTVRAGGYETTVSVSEASPEPIDGKTEDKNWLLYGLLLAVGIGAAILVAYYLKD